MVDRGLYLSGILFLVIGISGVWLANFSGIATSLRELKYISTLILIIGTIVLSLSFLRGGSIQLKYVISLLFVIIYGIGLLGIPYYISLKRQQITYTGEEVIIYLIAKEWAFNETNPTIKVTLGNKVHIIVINNGSVPHSFTVVELTGRDTGIIPPGSRGELILIANKVGVFEYLCPIPGHPELGMKGKFIVEKTMQEK